MKKYYENISGKTKILNFFRGIFANRILDPVLAALMRRLPFMKGFTGKIVPPEYLYKKPSYRTYDVNGIKMKLDISNLVDHFIYFSFEHKAISNFTNLLKENDTVIDVGGNIGYTALLFAKKCQKGSVISIEPSKELFTTLNEHVSLNDLSNVKALNIGLGEKPSTARLFKVDKFNSGMNRILESSEADQHSESIVIRTLDDVAESMNLQKIDAVKLDVEGYELKVLQGAVTTLKKTNPLLMIEVDDANLKEQQASRKLLFSFLHKLNYKAVDAETMQVIDLTGDHHHPHFDIICFPKTGQK